MSYNLMEELPNNSTLELEYHTLRGDADIVNITSPDNQPSSEIPTSIMLVIIFGVFCVIGAAAIDKHCRK